MEIIGQKFTKLDYSKPRKFFPCGPLGANSAHGHVACSLSSIPELTFCERAKICAGATV
jgi:hypothetical protein